MMTLFDQEYAVERYGDEKKAEGLAEGLAKGKIKAKQEMVYKLVDRKIVISDVVGVSVEMIKKWLDERSVIVR